ncbi:MAG: glycosyltransferase family 9 protein [Bacteroidaceae bacterium]|nr:glycosyltransferase family 9 protein [Bacteroidaceae bacterium]
MRRLLIIRLSAMGDVALTVPVVDCLACQNSDLRVTVLTKQQNVPLFDWMPANVEVVGVDVKRMKGVGGLERLYQQLKRRRFDAVADLHDVLRTKYLRTRFRMGGVPVAVIDKGRKAKRALLGHGMDLKALQHTTDRYADVLRRLGFDFKVDFERAFEPREENFAPIEKRVGRKMQGERWVGIAPFAAHEGKVYPLTRMRRVAEMLAGQGCRVFLFGAGQKERSVLEGWQTTDIVSTCGVLGGLHNEMLLMSRLDCMIAMDSANMHLAALVGTPVVSVWGATHPKAGFTPWRQGDVGIVERNDLPCRPCSVYGNKPCLFGDLRCMDITPESIVERVLKVL